MQIDPDKYPKGDKIPNFLKTVPVVIIVVLILFLIVAPPFVVIPSGYVFVVIPSGYVGVKITLGKADMDELPPGLNFIIPAVQRVVKMSVRTHSYDLRGANSINSLSKDGLTINTELTVLYKIKPDKAAEIYVEYGLDYESKIIKPVIQELEKRYIILDEILIRDIRLPKRVVEAIEQKRRAYEEMQKMKFVVEREKLEAERKRVEAKGIADANKIIAGSLTKEYLQWKFNKHSKHQEVGGTDGKSGNRYP